MATTEPAGASVPPDHIHDVASAARRVDVHPDTLRQWIKEGLRAVPIGRVGKDKGHRHYRIKDEWLMQFLDRRSEESARATFGESAPVAKRGRGAKPIVVLHGMDVNDPIGPIRRNGG